VVVHLAGMVLLDDVDRPARAHLAAGGLRRLRKPALGLVGLELARHGRPACRAGALASMSGARRLSNAPIAANVTLYNRGGKVVTHRLGWAIAIAVGLAGGASAQPPRVAPPPPAASVVTQLQAAYNAAQGAYDAGQWAQAND